MVLCTSVKARRLVSVLADRTIAGRITSTEEVFVGSGEVVL